MAGLHFSLACLGLQQRLSQNHPRPCDLAPSGDQNGEGGENVVRLSPTHPGTGSNPSGPTAGVAHVAETPGPDAGSSPKQRMHRG